VFEDKALADEAVVAVEKVVHHEEMGTAQTDRKPLGVEHVEIKDSNVRSGT
jgi:hypothetical protein